MFKGIMKNTQNTFIKNDAGAQGSVVAKILTDDPEIDKVILADINTQLLQRIAKKLTAANSPLNA